MIEKYLVLAKQKATQSKGLNFYVTKTGIKRDFNLFGGSFIYKVYFKDQIHVEDNKGVVVSQKEVKGKEDGAKKITVPSKLRNSKNETTSKDDESKQSELSTD